MLAQNFKRPADLKLSDKEHNALISALGVLERGEIKHIDVERIGRRIVVHKSRYYDHEGELAFNMREWFRDTACGTVACIGGYCDATYGTMFCGRGTNRDGELHGPEWQLDNLFCVFETDRPLSEITVEHAAAALRNYLTHGQARWPEVLDSYNRG